MLIGINPVITHRASFDTVCVWCGVVCMCVSYGVRVCGVVWCACVCGVVCMCVWYGVRVCGVECVCVMCVWCGGGGCVCVRVR
jgi:hypothetical protein